jgi:hypothetical protein
MGTRDISRTAAANITHLRKIIAMCNEENTTSNQKRDDEEDGAREVANGAAADDGVSSSILRDEKSQIVYPTGKKTRMATSHRGMKADDHPQPISKEPPAVPPSRQKSALLLEEKQNIIFPACRQQGQNEAAAAASAAAEQLPTIALDEGRSRPKKCWAEKEAKRPHPRNIATTSAAAKGMPRVQADITEPTISRENHANPEALVILDVADVDDDFSTGIVENHFANMTSSDSYQLATHDQEGDDDSDSYQLAPQDQEGDDEESNQPAMLSMFNNEQQLAQATLVSEPSHLNLPQASEVDIAQVEANAAAKRCQAMKRTFYFIASGILSVVGVTLLLFFLLRGRMSESVVLGTANNPDAPLVTTSLEDQIQSLLPDYTLAATRDAESPQYLAFQWTLNDTAASGDSYSDWQIVQRFALATLYYATGGDDWLNNTNWLNHSVHECLWFSMEKYGLPTYHYKANNPCNDGVFQHLWLWSNNLEGEVPPELLLLTSLQSISLHSNQFLGGTLPTLIAQLASLEALFVTTAKLSGTIPTEIGTLENLTDIVLFGNQLTGPIPTELGRLRRLEYFFLDSNASIHTF